MFNLFLDQILLFAILQDTATAKQTTKVRCRSYGAKHSFIDFSIPLLSFHPFRSSLIKPQKYLQGNHDELLGSYFEKRVKWFILVNCEPIYFHYFIIWKRYHVVTLVIFNTHCHWCDLQQASLVDQVASVLSDAQIKVGKCKMVQLLCDSMNG